MGKRNRKEPRMRLSPRDYLGTPMDLYPAPIKEGLHDFPSLCTRRAEAMGSGGFPLRSWWKYHRLSRFITKPSVVPFFTLDRLNALLT